MRTKLYVLGAVLGVVPVASTVWGPLSQESRLDSRGASRKGRGAGRVSPVPQGLDTHPGVAAPPGSAPSVPGAPTHPCELITLMKVPCEPAGAACEHTYWQCPQQVKPLKA